MQQDKVGLPPGSLVFIGEKRTDPVHFSLLDYQHDSFFEKELDGIDECKQHVDNTSVSWFNFDGIHDAAILSQLGESFGLHHLVLEDVMNSVHRPKLEEYDKYLFLTLKMLSLSEKKNVQSEQVSLILGKDWLLSFQEQAGDVFEPIRNRIRTGKGQVRSRRTDYLLYLLVDIVVDNYYLVTRHLYDQAEELESRSYEESGSELTREIQDLKKAVLEVKRAIFPLKEGVNVLRNTDAELIESKNVRYFSDVHDHIVMVLDELDQTREVLSNAFDVYSISAGNRMNQIMKVLTIVSSIFIPLTFVAGIYGMNFNPEAGSTNMPELNWEYGYLFVWGLMVVLLIGMFLFFKRKKWF